MTSGIGGLSGMVSADEGQKEVARDAVFSKEKE
jgi:hypothetical protein